MSSSLRERKVALGRAELPEEIAADFLRMTRTTRQLNLGMSRDERKY